MPNEEADIAEIGKQLGALELSFSFDGTQVYVDWFQAYHGHNMPSEKWHFHRGLELHFILEGTVRFTFETGDSLLGAGQAIAIPDHCLHRLTNGSPEPYTRYVMCFTLDSLEEGALAPVIGAIQLDKPTCFFTSPDMTASLTHCMREVALRAGGYRQMIQLNTLSLIIAVARELGRSQREPHGVKEKVPIDLMRYRRALSYITDNADTLLSVGDVAAHLQIGERQLQRIFHRERGDSVNSAILESRLNHAKTLLKDSTLSIAQISARLGYAKEQCFSRFFYSQQGQLPSQYRRAALPNTLPRSQ